MPKVVPEYKEQARARIVEAAGAVFRRRGLPGGTMDEIAREIGVSKGALYLYFPTKARLLAAVQEELRDHYVGLLERQLARGDPAEGFVRALDRILQGEFDVSVWHQLVTEAIVDPEIREVLRQDARADRKNIHRLLEQLARQGRIRPAGPMEDTVDTILLLFQGTLAAVVHRGDPSDAREQLVRALRIVLGTRPARSRRR